MILGGQLPVKASESTMASEPAMASIEIKQTRTTRHDLNRSDLP
jgi:hypothetical protein